MKKNFANSEEAKLLSRNNELLEAIIKSIALQELNTEDQEETLEKSLGKTRAPQARPIKIVSSTEYKGHIGTGIRPTARSNMAAKIIASLSGNNAAAQTSQAFPVITFSGNSNSSSGDTRSEWEMHPHCTVGSFAYVQHPYKHEKPTWVRITAIGKHGIHGKENGESSHNIRWPHIMEIHPAVGHGLHAAEDKEIIEELAKLGMPMEAEKDLTSNELLHAEEYLRGLKIPIMADLIHNEIDDSGDAYDDLRNIHAPIDPIDSTIDKDGKSTMLPAHLGELIQELQSMGKPIDVEKLSRLPKDEILKVLKHYFGESK